MALDTSFYPNDFIKIHFNKKTHRIYLENLVIGGSKERIKLWILSNAIQLRNGAKRLK